MLYTCPCCGYKTLSQEPPGTFDICLICGWEDDNVQFKDPEYKGGANKVSLHEAQKNFIKFGASDERSRELIRKPISEFEKDPKWVPLLKKLPAG